MLILSYGQKGEHAVRNMNMNMYSGGVVVYNNQ
jgi:hypothetical protein